MKILNRLQITAGTVSDVFTILKTATNDYSDKLNFLVSFKVPKIKVDVEGKVTNAVCNYHSERDTSFDNFSVRDKSKIYIFNEIEFINDVDDLFVSINLSEYGDEEEGYSVSFSNLKIVDDLKNGKFTLTSKTCDVQHYGTTIHENIPCKFKLEYQAPADYVYVDESLLRDEKTIKKLFLNCFKGISDVALKSFKYDPSNNKIFTKYVVSNPYQIPDGYFNRFICEPNEDEFDDGDFYPYGIDLNDAQEELKQKVEDFEDIAYSLDGVWGGLNNFSSDFAKMFSKNIPPIVIADITFKK